MNASCFKHPEKVAVAKIARHFSQMTPGGVEEMAMFSPVCQECAEQASRIDMRLFPLSHPILPAPFEPPNGEFR
jgi:hypothetical protein